MDPAGASFDEHRPLSPRVQVLWQLPFAVLAIVVLLAAAIALAAGAPTGVGVVLLVLTGLFLVLLVTVPKARYRNWSYRLSADQLDIRKGIVVKEESTVPYFRVQHIDIRRGPLERWRNVVSLDISTASPSTDSTLPGIDPADADRIRAYVLARAGYDDGV
ncbi:MAG: PH domain-containing protein [Actinobacteria bacterium]|nr:PH domain-containing protein [Actinomycetota bacterium]